MPAPLPPPQGAVAKWKKAVGDKVVPGDILAEIQTARVLQRSAPRAPALLPCLLLSAHAASLLSC